MNLVFIAKRSVRFVVTNQCAAERFTIDSVMGSQRFRANPALYAGRHIQANQQDHHKRQSERERPQRRTQMHVLRDQRTEDRRSRPAQGAYVIGETQTGSALVGVEVAADQFR